MPNRRGRACGFAVIMGAAGVVGAGYAATIPTIRFDIRKGETPDTIREFQRQSHAKISYRPEIHVKTNRVHGEYSPDVALAKLLRGTGLKGTFLPHGEVAIEPVEPGEVSAPQA